MKQKITDIFENLNHDKSSRILNIIQLVVLFIVLGNIILYVMHDDNNTYIKNEKNGYVYHKLYQHSFKSSLINIENEPCILEKMENTLYNLKNEESFLYTSMARGALSIPKSYCEKKFTPEALGMFQEDLGGQVVANREENQDEYVNFSMYKVDKEAIDHYQIQVNEGRQFNNNDFVYTIGDKRISVLLGAEYQTIYNLGETIPISLNGKILSAEIVGFLSKGIAIKNDTTFEHVGEKNEYLDRSIIIPCYQIVGDIIKDEDKMFATLEYVTNLCGTLIFSDEVPENDIREQLKKINDIYINNGVFSVVLLNTTNGMIYFQGEKKEIVELIKVLTAIVFVSIIISLYLSSYINLDKQGYKTAVQMLNGRLGSDVKLCYVFEVILIFITAIIIFFALDDMWFYQTIRFYIYFFAFIFLMAIFDIVLIRKRIDLFNVGRYLRREEDVYLEKY
ncbi:hypothetical protein [Ohessyouella blattaphilus]|uniref:Uncharacterized protein n=1 Tax=Ohessyouella blattaphilus TaxID=2949333 RepID=A0ABT1EP96_9FIRM|nr:hypothetical protein [Ohessyouella blattaphilus]MCP1111511.1 hypothetical protein [Ohessyouella blattaphilus]MCR8564905.1 hypothetical protein [Ohessyouella blattaphilus]